MTDNPPLRFRRTAFGSEVDGKPLGKPGDFDQTQMVGGQYCVLQTYVNGEWIDVPVEDQP